MGSIIKGLIFIAIGATAINCIGNAILTSMKVGDEIKDRIND